MKWVIKSVEEFDDETGENLYWNNQQGWVDKKSATVFTQEEYENFDYIAAGSVWEKTYRITKNQITNSSLVGNLLLHYLGRDAPLLKEVVETGYADVKLTINETEVDFMDFMTHLELNINKGIEEKARELVEEKTNNLCDQLTAFSDELKTKLNDKLDALFPLDTR